MDIAVKEKNKNSVCVVELRGRFDAHEVGGFGSTVDRLIDDGVATIGVDLSSVEFIDSSALAELVRYSKTLRAKGHSLDLIQPSDPVRVILELTGLEQAFVIHHVSLDEPVGPG